MFSKRLKEVRFKFELTQDDLAKMLGVSQQTVANWETGKSAPNIAMLKEISQRFNVTADYLLGNDEADEVPQLSEEQTILLGDMEELDAVNKQKVFSYIRDLIRSQRFSRQVKSSTLKTFSARPKIRMRG